MLRQTSLRFATTALALDTILNHKLGIGRLRHGKNRVSRLIHNLLIISPAIPSCNQHPRQYQRAFAPIAPNPEGRGKGRRQPDLPSDVVGFSCRIQCVSCIPDRSSSVAGKSGLNRRYPATSEEKQRCASPRNWIGNQDILCLRLFSLDSSMLLT
jgi:hypothetical protein